MLNPQDIVSLRQIDMLADRYEKIACLLRSAVNKCADQQTTKGLYDMVAMAFNAGQYQPSYGGGGGLPPGKYKGVIVDSRQENVEKQGQVVGGFLAFDLTPIEGALAGTKHTDRLNLHNMKSQVVEIANKQLSAYCAVIGVPGFNDTSELHNKPFLFEIGYQKGEEPSEAKPNGGYTEVKAIYDINGNPPSKAGSGAAPAQQNVAIPQQAAGGVTAQGGWNGAPAQGGGQPPAQQGAPGGWGQQQPPQQQGGQPPAQQGAAQWGQQQPPAQQGGATGWGGAPAQGGGQPPQQAAGGWNQQAGGAPAQPGWGAPQG